ncbi:unnamed protein product, partial [Schistosoma turkestanicum]
STVKADQLFKYENPFHSVVDTSIKLLSLSVDECVKPIELIEDMNKIDLNALNDAFNKTVKSNQAALSLVGPNLGAIEPVQVLLKE